MMTSSNSETLTGLLKGRANLLADLEPIRSKIADLTALRDAQREQVADLHRAVALEVGYAAITQGKIDLETFGAEPLETMLKQCEEAIVANGGRI